MTDRNHRTRAELENKLTRLKGPAREKVVRALARFLAEEKEKARRLAKLRNLDR